MISSSIILILLMIIPLGYLLTLLFSSIRVRLPLYSEDQKPLTRFIILIPAHNEACVIAKTIRQIHLMDYPSDLYCVYVIADHCTDATAILAEQAGGCVHICQDGPRGGKGSAIAWFMSHVSVTDWDAVVIFDADTQVDPKFLRVMNSRITNGDLVIQGQHIISNPRAGWFPALTWAMFLIDNRIQNMGRSNLGWSAKHMGDSICFRTDIFCRLGCGQGLTEDYQLRQRMLLEGINIVYEPRAIGRGESASSLSEARAQRSRWLRGTNDASKQYAWELAKDWVKKRKTALLDGALQAVFPSYSTLTILSVPIFLFQLGLNVWIDDEVFPWTLILSWAFVVCVLFLYPFMGLALEHAPLRAYMAISFGPFFIFWRTWLAIKVRLGKNKVIWIRTTHRGES